MSNKKPEKGSGNLSKIREKKGESNAFKYEGTKAGKAYAGPDKTFPIGDAKHAKAALSRAHFAANPNAIREAVHKKYPKMGKEKKK
jgi:hypothetical protein